MTQPVAISTKDFAKPYAPDIPVGVGDVVMMAKCPKDTVWDALGEIQGANDGQFGKKELRDLVLAVFGPEDGPKALAMMDDPANHEVNMESLGGLIGWCMEKWGPDVQEHFEKLRAGAGNRAQRRVAVKKAPGPASAAAKKTAARKSAAAKTAAAKTTARRS